MTARSRISVPHLAAMALVFACLLLATAGAAAALAAVQSMPLADDTGGVQALPPSGDTSGVQLPPFLQGEPAPGAGGQPAPAGTAPGVEKSAPGAAPVAGLPPARDATIIAYLIELARRQSAPCPSGVTPPAPPSLVFSEPLSRVAAAVLGGADVQAAAATEGIPLARWRLFSAGDTPAKAVVDGLRQSHCEALLEPYTLIGAARSPAGWRVLLAAPRGLEDAEPPTPGPAAAGGFPTPAAVPPASPAAPVPSSAAPGRGAVAVPAGAAASGAVAGINSQRPRELFIQLNERRKMGGSCGGTALPSSPPLVFDRVLQAEAEKDVVRSGPLPYASLVDGYKGSLVTKMAGISQGGGGPLLDVWLMDPSRCATLLSPDFTDAGIAVANDSWVLVLGGKGKGVPSAEPPGAAARSNADANR